VRENKVVIPFPVREISWNGSAFEGGWEVIVADPPWRFNDRGMRLAPDQREKRRRRKGYRTLPLEAIKAMPVEAIVARDALLFLWTTSAHLVDGSATAVARAWGFEPKTTIVWVKARFPTVAWALVKALTSVLFGPRMDRAVAKSRAKLLLAEVRHSLQRLVFQIGGGHYTRGAHELVVVAARGRATRLVADKGVPSVVVAPRAARSSGETHSVKPEAFRDLVDRLTGGRSVLELFARSGRKGWTTWGDQAPDDSTDRRCG
jgi:N6-adenosine-specific RNA methylase IME4